MCHHNATIVISTKMFVTSISRFLSVMYVSFAAESKEASFIDGLPACSPMFYVMVMCMVSVVGLLLYSVACDTAFTTSIAVCLIPCVTASAISYICLLFCFF